MANRARPTAIYRLYSTDGVLLYIGKSVNPSFRWERHAEHDPWWAEVARKTLEWFDKSQAATNSYRKAVRVESPARNPECVDISADREWCINTAFGSTTAKALALYILVAGSGDLCIPLDCGAIAKFLESSEQDVQSAARRLASDGYARIYEATRGHSGEVLQLLTPTRLASDARYRDDQAENEAREALRAVKPVRPPIPRELRAAVYERDGHACLKCGATSKLTLDHIHPWSKGGLDTMENLQTLCGSCNSRKQDSIEGAA